MDKIDLEEKFCTDRESYLKFPEKFNKIYITENKEYLRVYIGGSVVYYRNEKNEWQKSRTTGS